MRKLTGSSLQSVEQVTNTLTALGLTPHKDLYKEARGLKELFEVRNKIAHEMDMTHHAISTRGTRSRNERPVTKYRNLCHGGLEFAQRVINQVANEVQESDS
ncbi:hypothetical protein [Amycolatopsis sp. NPDC003861]